jgi:hypothetical protein
MASILDNTFMTQLHPITATGFTRIGSFTFHKHQTKHFGTTTVNLFGALNATKVVVNGSLPMKHTLMWMVIVSNVLDLHRRLNHHMAFYDILLYHSLTLRIIRETNELLLSKMASTFLRLQQLRQHLPM